MANGKKRVPKILQEVRSKISRKNSKQNKNQKNKSRRAQNIYRQYQVKPPYLEKELHLEISQMSMAGKFQHHPMQIRLHIESFKLEISF